MHSLDKRRLKLIEIQSFPQTIETSQLLDNDCKEPFSPKKELEYVFVAKMHDRVLVATFFNIKTGAAQFRMFFNRKNFVTQWLDAEPKWSTATLGSMWYSNCYLNKTVCANEKSAGVIKKFFQSEESPYKAMELFQYALRNEQLGQRHQKEINRIDDRMKVIRPLPKDFARWVNEVPLNFSRYIFYQRVSSRLIKGYCTSCKNDVEFIITAKTPQNNVRHKKQGKCPQCKKAVTFRAEGRTGNFTDKAYCTYIQKTKTGFVLRSFDITKRYSSSPESPDYYRHPALDVFENARHFFDRDSNWTGADKHFVFGKFKQTDIYRWCQSAVNSWTTPLYTRNLRHVLAGTPWQHSAIYEFATNVNMVSIQRYLGEYLKYPAYEYLVKARLYRLVAETIGFYNNCKLNFDGRNMPEILGISKAGIKQMQRFDGHSTHLNLIRIAEKLGKCLTDDQLRCFMEMDIHHDMINGFLEITTPQKAINYIHRCMKNWEQKQNSNPFSKIAVYWRDYLNNCELLGYDMGNDFNIFPRDLKASHDKAVAAYGDVLATQKAEKVAKESVMIAELHPSLQKAFGFVHEGLGLVAVAPTSRDEIVAEGEILRHCVHTGSYISRMVEGKGYILFVRKADSPDIPYFTAEVVNGVVQQCRGKSNNDMPDDVKKFIGLWQKKLKKRNTESINIASAATALVAA